MGDVNFMNTKAIAGIGLKMKLSVFFRKLYAARGGRKRELSRLSIVLRTQRNVMANN